MINRGSGFSSLHPWLCFFYFLALLLFAMFFKHPFYLASLLFCTIIFNFFLDRGESLKKKAKFYLLIAAIVIVLNPLFSQRGATILFYLGHRPVTLESMIYGVLFALILLSIMFVFLAYNLVISPDRFLYLFSSFAPRTAFIITVTLRFIPLLQHRLREIISVQKAIGGGEGESKKQKAKEAMEVLNILVTWSLESALQKAISMRARGYGSGKRSSAVAFSFDKRDLFCMSFMAVTGGLALLGGFFGYGTFTVYPSLEAKYPLFNWHFIFFLLFISFPIFMESREWIWWRFIRSKI